MLNKICCVLCECTEQKATCGGIEICACNRTVVHPQVLLGVNGVSVAALRVRIL
jgi:hypothetical protein